MRVLSFHPCFSGDRNILCAGREPDEKDASAVREADAVILPQGCSRALYDMVRTHCENVFPDYTVRFAYPKKIGQIRLFREMNTPHPPTACFRCLDDFPHHARKNDYGLSFGFPMVFKFNWGGEGNNVFLIQSHKDMEILIKKAATYERTGQRGFMVQEYIPCGNRSLRVAVIGDRLFPYWRIQENSREFVTSASRGCRLDWEGDAPLKQSGVAAVTTFIKKTGINLAGFDLIFTEDGLPLFLEINYFFGRRGLGGSRRYYSMLEAAILCWLETLGVPMVTIASEG